jgi:hypothetical protein
MHAPGVQDVYGGVTDLAMQFRREVIYAPQRCRRRLPNTHGKQPRTSQALRNDDARNPRSGTRLRAYQIRSSRPHVMARNRSQALYVAVSQGSLRHFKFLHKAHVLGCLAKPVRKPCHGIHVMLPNYRRMRGSAPAKRRGAVIWLQHRQYSHRIRLLQIKQCQRICRTCIATVAAPVEFRSRDGIKAQSFSTRRPEIVFTGSAALALPGGVQIYRNSRCSISVFRICIVERPNPQDALCARTARAGWRTAHEPLASANRPCRAAAPLCRRRIR